MKKVLFGITSLTLGGAERVLVDIANSLCEKYDITIFTIYANGELEKQLNKKIKLKTIYSVSYKKLSKIKQKILAPLKILLFKNMIYKKKIKGDYDVEIAFLEGPITRLFSVKNTKAKKIVWIHNDISNVFGSGIKSKVKKVIDKRIYGKYNELIFVSKDNLKKFNMFYPKLSNIKKRVIYNYLDKDSILKKANEEIDFKFENDVLNFVTVARLVKQKGIDRIIRVHKRLLEEDLLHNFYVIGDGPEKDGLEAMVKKYKIANTFYLLGKKENPYPYIKNADCFCLLSNYEGYGMVLEEAKILNKYILITDTAAREAVEDYESKQITENSEEGIYDGIKNVIKQKNVEKCLEKRKKLEYNNKELLDDVIKLIEE